MNRTSAVVWLGVELALGWREGSARVKLGLLSTRTPYMNKTFYNIFTNNCVLKLNHPWTMKCVVMN